MVQQCKIPAWVLMKKIHLEIRNRAFLHRLAKLLNTATSQNLIRSVDSNTMTIAEAEGVVETRDYPNNMPDLLLHGDYTQFVFVLLACRLHIPSELDRNELRSIKQDRFCKYSPSLFTSQDILAYGFLYIRGNHICPIVACRIEKHSR